MSYQTSCVVDRDSQHAVAGLSMKGGQKENFYLSLIQYFPTYKRWSLTQLSPMKDYPVAGENTIQYWVKEHDLRHLVLDFPLSPPACLNCTLECPGSDTCIDPSIMALRLEIETLLIIDAKEYEKNPKQYEYERLELEQIQTSFSKNESRILSKSFKKRLKKGIIPYWHRGIDLWAWVKYYDLFLYFFKTSFDSLGGSSLMLMNRFEYIKKHLSSHLTLWESDTRFVLLEFFIGGVIKERYLRGLGQLDEAHISRKAILKNIEDKLNIFIYEHDQETLETNLKAFDSFLLAIAGVCQQQGWTQPMPEWMKKQHDFIVPRFTLG